MNTLLIRNGTVITADSQILADIYIEDELIKEIAPHIKHIAQKEIDASGCYIFPGGIDPHTHMDLPVMGTHSSDDFESGSRAALFGGTTTIIDFANQTRGNTLSEALKLWHQKAARKTLTDYSFHVSVTEVNDSTEAEIKQMVENEGITSFKTFLAYPQMKLDITSLKRLLKILKKYGALLTNHAEDGELIEKLLASHQTNKQEAPLYHYLTRPAVVEEKAVSQMISLAQEENYPVYLVHLSTEQAARLVHQARQKNIPVIGETCPQYLLLDHQLYDNEIALEAAKYIMSPPAREAKDRAALWESLGNDSLQVVGTDHCPFMLAQKQKGLPHFWSIPNGIPGIENRLELLYNFGVLKGLITLSQFVKLTSTNPAKIFGLYPQKGTIAVGSHADIVIFDPNRRSTISAANHHMNVDYNPYEGYQLTGKCQTVILRGNIAIEQDQCLIPRGFGRFIKRSKPLL